MDLRYPIGPHEYTRLMSARERIECIRQIEAAPARLRAVVEDLSDDQLETPYRPDGWTVRQVVHHLPDSHMNAYIRVRLALTEDTPTIRPYDEASWARLPDAQSGPIAVSLDLMDALHRRLTAMLRSLGDDECKRTFNHPEIGTVSIDRNIGLYAWHGRHHVAHITSLRQRMEWN
jgi:uncharacterized damage-inducible protein DinB